MAGRPTKFNKKLSSKICQLLSEGNSLRSICRRKSMPSASAVFRWIMEHKEFKEQYELALVSRADALAEDILDIADNGSNDWIENNDSDNSGYKLNGEHIQRSRLRVDARKWIAAKMQPKKYGDKIHQEITKYKDTAEVLEAARRRAEKAREVVKSFDEANKSNHSHTSKEKI